MPTTFLRLINDILHKKIDIFVIIYFDDILVFLKDAYAHKKHFVGFFISLKNIT